MKRPARRTILKVLLLLAAGATLNVAVAWACVQWSPKTLLRTDAEDVLGRLEVEPNVPDEWTFGARTAFLHGVGVEQIKTTYFASAPEYWSQWQVSLDVSAGWPLRSMQGNADYHRFPSSRWVRNGTMANRGNGLNGGGPDLIWRDLPTHAITLGFAVNTLFYAGVLWVLFGGPFALRRTIRRRRGQCPACAYPIGQSPVCTECGAGVKRSP